MSRDYIDLGSTPANESCEQLGPNYDPQKAQAECRRYRELIRETVGLEPAGAALVVKSNSHDFGTYYEVHVTFDTDDPEAIDYAFRCDNEAPVTWTP